MDAEDCCYLLGSAAFVGGLWWIFPPYGLIALGLCIGAVPVIVRLFRRPKGDKP